MYILTKRKVQRERTKLFINFFFFFKVEQNDISILQMIDSVSDFFAKLWSTLDLYEFHWILYEFPRATRIKFEILIEDSMISSLHDVCRTMESL